MTADSVTMRPSISRTGRRPEGTCRWAGGDAAGGHGRGGQGHAFSGCILRACMSALCLP
jgi:hypothetical protein